MFFDSVLIALALIAVVATCSAILKRATDEFGGE